MRRSIITLMIVSLLAAILPPVSTLGEDTETAGGAALMPADLDLYTWFDTADLETNLSQIILMLDRISGLVGDMSFANAGRLIESVLNEPLWNLDLDYQRDLLPWLGDELALGLRGFPDVSLTPYPATPDYVMVIETADRSATLALMQRTLSTRKRVGMPFNEAIYGDVALYDSRRLAIALLGDYLAVGTPGMVREVIDVHNGAPSLADADAFDKVMAGVPEGSVAGAFLGARNFASFLANALPFSPEVSDVAARAANPVRGGAVSVRMSENAMMLDVTFAVDMDAVERVFGPEMRGFVPGEVSGRVFQALPGDTFAVLAGQDLAQMLDTLRAGLPMLEPLAAQLNHRLVYQHGYQGPALSGLLRVAFEQGLVWFARLFGLDIEDDVLAWMGAEYAVALVPMSQHLLAGRTSRFPLDMIAVSEVTDPDLARAASEQFNQAVRDLGFPGLTQEVSGVPMYSIRLAQHQRFYVSWALTEAFGAIATGTESINRFIHVTESGAMESMLDNPRLREALNYMDGAGHTMLFIDLAQGLPYLLRALPADSPFRWQFAPMLSNYDSLAVSGRALDTDVYRLTFLGVLSQ